MEVDPRNELPATTGDALFARIMVEGLMKMLVTNGVVSKLDMANLIARNLRVYSQSGPIPWPGHPVAMEVLVSNLQEFLGEILAIPDEQPRDPAPQ